jgi:photosystem II stability/assembly factor-like uncharacterized protein
LNTTSNLRQALSEEVERLRPRAGLEERVLRGLRANSQPIQRQRVGRPRQQERGEWVRPHPATALIAALLTIVVVVTLVYAARSSHQVQSSPATVPRPGTVVVPVTLPAWTWFFSPKDAALLIDVADPKNPNGVLSERLLITHDGGRNWLSTDEPAIVGGPRVFWIDAKHIVYDAESGIETTTDGGIHWTRTQVEPGFEGAFWSTYFLTTTEGWALQSNNVIYRTSDSGASWEKLATIGSDLAAPSPQLIFTDPMHGFIAGNSQDGAGRFFVTSDGGRTWRLVPLPAPAAGWPAYGTIEVPTFFGKQGFALYTASGGTFYVYFTADAGSTWSSPRPFPYYPGRPTFINTSDGWAVDSTGVEYRTFDGGISWQAVSYSLPGYLLRTIAPVGGDVVWATASKAGSPIDYGVRSTDGGVTWSFIKLPVQ